MSFLRITNKLLQENKVKTPKALWEKVGKDYRGLSMDVDVEFKQAKSKNKNLFDVVMSTPKENRNGHKIDQNFTLTNFKNNPVFIDSHDYSTIFNILGKVINVKVKDNKLIGQIEFLLDSPKGLLAYKMAMGGFLTAVSVGLEPLSFGKDGSVSKSDLLELSAVAIPADPKTLLVKNNKKKKAIKKVKKVDKLEESITEKEEKRKNILEEVLAVTQRLSQVKVDEKKGKQMANRIIKQMLKIK